MFAPPPPPGPGLAKARQGGTIARRGLELRAVRDGWWAAMLARADIVSEGSVVTEEEGDMYYGTTSLWCPLDDGLASAAGAPSTTAMADLMHLILADGHARLRLLRVAHREAVVRAPGPLGVLSAELSGHLRSAHGKPMLVVEVDVSASVVVERAIGLR